MFMITHSQSRRSLQCCELVHTEAVEDCLRVIFKLSGRNERANTSVLAQRLDVSAPTVSAMLKRLEAGDLIVRTRHHVELTAHGERHALDVTRRHRLLEAFLSQVLEVPWDEVHAEADALEHAISPQLEARMDAFLGYPTQDPHGDPIPPAMGEHVEAWAVPLTQAAAGRQFRVERVSDRDSAALRHLAGLQIRPGAVLEVIEREPFGGPLWVSVEGRRHALGLELAEAVHGKSGA